MSYHLHELTRSRGANRDKKRVGRGPGSGLGVRAGRGQKGQKSRSGYSRKLGFEGGQMPLYRRIPKRGFKNPFAKQYAVINVQQLNRFEDGTEVTPEVVVQAGLVKRIRDGVRILGEGRLEKRLTVKAHHFSAAAKAKIEAAGGAIEVLS